MVYGIWYMVVHGVRCTVCVATYRQAGAGVCTYLRTSYYFYYYYVLLLLLLRLLLYYYYYY